MCGGQQSNGQFGSSGPSQSASSGVVNQTPAEDNNKVANTDHQGPHNQPRQAAGKPILAEDNNQEACLDFKEEGEWASRVPIRRLWYLQHVRVQQQSGQSSGQFGGRALVVAEHHPTMAAVNQQWVDFSLLPWECRDSSSRMEAKQLDKDVEGVRVAGATVEGADHPGLNQCVQAVTAAVVEAPRHLLVPTIVERVPQNYCMN